MVLAKADNERLCRVEGDAPMGQWVRRFWIPFLFSEDLPRIDCPPVRVKLLGEELVLDGADELQKGIEPPAGHRRCRPRRSTVPAACGSVWGRRACSRGSCDVRLARPLPPGSPPLVVGAAAGPSGGTGCATWRRRSPSSTRTAGRSIPTA